VVSVDGAGRWSAVASYGFATGSPGKVTAPTTSTASPGQVAVKV